jgi:serine/threonine protein kinase
MDLHTIGRYDIKSLIGQGGMSTVYLGYDPRSQREVAIKILPPYYLHAPKFRERFEREALMIALLEHPAIVPVYDMGEEDGQPYIVMRYMSGGSLSDKLKRGPIPLRECMEMYLRLAPALDTAHTRGVIHRDVKPDNLLFDKYDNVFLSDFGLARLRETIGFANISDGTIMGTPAYMSPEQIQGDRELDGRSDIYSMGIVLYQMLCGSVPFSGNTAASVMMMHLVNPVPQISDLNKTLPSGIQSVLEIALAKNPKDRYQTAGEFARAIQSVTTGVQRKPSIHPTGGDAAVRPARQSAIPIPDEPTASSEDGVESAVSQAFPINSIKTPLPGEVIHRRPQLSSASPSTPGIASRQKHRITLPWWGWLIGLIVVVLVSLTLILRTLGIFPFTAFSQAGNPAGDQQAQSVLTAQPTETPALGRADKLAFLKSSEIWVSNLDGSDPAQLTTDGEEKSNLLWSPDGQSVLYTSSSCLNLVGLLTHQVHILTCFSGSPSITAFDISPDGQKVALGLAQSDLYLLPYTQLFNLHQTSSPGDLVPLAQCAYYAPYHTDQVLKSVNWSLDNNRLALLLSTPINGILRDEVSILDFGQCSASPLVVKEISPTYFLFTLSGYFEHPVISSLSWNSSDQLLLNGDTNEAGFGDLQVYDLAQNQGQQLSPNGTCCYRDAHWSPDGTYLFYSYQPQAGGEISLYYTPTSELSQPGSQVASLAQLAEFIGGDLESLQPALRTAH